MLIPNWLLISLISWADFQNSPFSMLCIHLDLSTLPYGDNLNHEYASRNGGNVGGFKQNLYYKYIYV